MYKNIPIKTVETNAEQHYNHDQMLSMIHRLVNERDVLWRENEYLKAKLNESLLMETINEMKKERELLLKLLVNLTAKENTNGHHPPPPREDQAQYPNHYSDENTNNGYSHDPVPPPPYQTYNNTPNGKNMHASSPSTRRYASNARNYQAPLNHRDLSTTLVTEPKPTRRSHRIKTSQAEPQQTQPAAVYRVEGTKECLMNPGELSSVFAHVKHSHPNKKIVVYKTSTTPQTHEFHQLVDEMCLKHGVELKHSQNSPFQQYRSQSLQDLTSASTTSFPTPREFDFQFTPIEKHEHSRTTYVKK